MRNSQSYSYSLSWSDEDRGYISTSAEFPGLSAFGESPEQALAELRQAIEGAIATLEEEGLEVPAPQVRTAYSGQFRLRLPRHLHAWLSERAAGEEVSLNTLVLSYVSLGLGAASAEQFVSRECGDVLRKVQGAVGDLEERSKTLRSLCDTSQGFLETLMSLRVDSTSIQWDRLGRAQLDVMPPSTVRTAGETKLAA